MSRALSNIVAIIITTIILVVASSIVLMKSNLVISALKPRNEIEIDATCSRILDSSLYLCLVKFYVDYCGKLEIITVNGSISIDGCYSPRKPLVLPLSSRPIAIRIGSVMQQVELR